MKNRSIRGCIRPSAFVLAVCTLFLLGNGVAFLPAASKPPHTGIKLEGYATDVTPTSITVFDKKNREITIQTDKDYTSLVGMGAAVTVWYTTHAGAHHLEDIIYPLGGTFVPSNTIRQDIKRIIILPQPEGVENTEGLISAISNYLTEHAGWYVAPPELAMEVARRTRVPTSPLDAINSNTGEVNMQQYLEPQRALMMQIAQETHSDAVLEVRIIKVKAHVRASKASWDGMTETVAGWKSRAFTPFGGLGGSDWVYAATTDMSLWSRAGTLLWKTRRGFAVLGVKSGMGAGYHQRPLTEVYQQTNTMQRWLESTLGQLTSPSGTSAGGLRPSPEVQREIEKAKEAGQQEK